MKGKIDFCKRLIALAFFGAVLLSCASVPDQAHSPGVSGFALREMSLSGELYGLDEISVFFPRELFFISRSEESFLAFFRENGGVIPQWETLANDIVTFWENYPENAGTVDIGVSFPPANLTAVGLMLEEAIQSILETVIRDFDSISNFARETNEAYTRFVFFADLEALSEDASVIWLFDFVFPSLGQFEYVSRVIHLYNMVELKEIVFYMEDKNTLERIGIYSFFDDAPAGLSMRHGIFWGD
ncbi:MAG: hypothetical protein FWG66_07360 [Spirochaetes bacterium]|nr:hypothetical protein [Spirochaetota bacterium]